MSQGAFLGSSKRGLHLQDICADFVQEVLIVRDDESDSFKAMLQIRLQPNQSMQIQMIGGLRERGRGGRVREEGGGSSPHQAEEDQV
jgi:hypothetical protein